MEDEDEKLVPRWRAKKTVSIRTFIATIVLFLVALLLLGLGLGLGLPKSTSSLSSPDDTSPSPANFGLPDHLETIAPDKLVNATELALETGFVVTRIPTTRAYELTVTQALAAPDGVYKPMILANGQSPGPLIEANSGDTLRVTVHNRMANTTTSIHWHGIDQRNTSWMDGVRGVSQCGIPPGASFTYEFTLAGQRGTFWYHAHQEIQYTDGLYGPLVVHDADERVPAADTERVVFVGENFHAYGAALLASYLQPASAWWPAGPGVEPLADNFLVNGRHTADCAVASSTYNASSSAAARAAYSTTASPPCDGGALSATPVRAGQTVRLRLISHASFATFWVSLDSHAFTLVEIDGVAVAPLAQRGVHVAPGQRHSVLVTADQPAGAYALRATLPRSCFLPYAPYTSAGLEAVGYQGVGLVVYEGAAPGERMGLQGNVSNPYGVENNPARGDVWEGCDDLPFDLAVLAVEMAAVEVAPENAYEVEFQFKEVGAVNRIFINKMPVASDRQTSWSPYLDDAQIWAAQDQNFIPGKAGSYNNWNFRLDQQVLVLPAANKGAQIAINSLDVMAHPFHFHGHAVQLVGWGPGRFSAAAAAAPGANTTTTTTTTTWNLRNPLRRDTFLVPGNTHVVLRFVADNPGLWALHCHVAWHMEGGMFVTFLEQPDDL